MTARIITFFEKVGSWLKKLFTNPKTEQTILATIKYVAPFIETLVGLAAGGPAEILVTNIVNQVQADLATVAVVVQEGIPPAGSTAAQQAETALNSIKTNLTALLADADVKNSAKVAEITSTVNLIAGEADAMLSGFSSSTPPQAISA